MDPPMTDQPPIRIEVDERDDDVVIAHMIGDAGLANVDDLSREMVKLSSRRIPVTIFDMSQLVFACSLAIGTFIQYQQGARNHDGVVHFCGFNETLSKALNKANLHLVLNIYDNVDDALASV